MVQKQSKKKRFGFLISFLIKILLITALCITLFTWVFGVYRMRGNSMFPAVRDGDLCIYYKLDDYHQNDVIFYYDANGSLHLGRVLGQAGQTITFGENGGYLVDGYTPSDLNPYPTYGIDTLEFIVPEQAVFVLNDFREDLSDSRTYGSIPQEQIVGKLLFLFRRRGF